MDCEMATKIAPKTTPKANALVRTGEALPWLPPAKQAPSQVSRLPRGGWRRYPDCTLLSPSVAAHSMGSARSELIGRGLIVDTTRATDLKSQSTAISNGIGSLHR